MGRRTEVGVRRLRLAARRRLRAPHPRGGQARRAAADEAESEALDAIEFAVYAIQEAEYAVLDAAVARDEADARAAAAAAGQASAAYDDPATS